MELEATALKTPQRTALADPHAWQSFTAGFDQNPDQFAHIPGLVNPEPLLAAVQRATGELRRYDHHGTPRLRVFSGNLLDYPAIERFCYDTDPADDVFGFLESHAGESNCCIGINELESWDPQLRELVATEFIPGLSPYLRRTASHADWYAFLATGGWTSFGIHDDDEPSLVMNLGPSERDIWVWEPQALPRLDRGRRTSLNFEHLLPLATHHRVLDPGDFAVIPTGWFHLFRSHGPSTLFGVAPYRRDVPAEVCEYLNGKGVDPLQWFGDSAAGDAVHRRIAAVRRHIDLAVESAAFSTAAVRVTPLGGEATLPQELRALAPLILVESPTLLLANGSTVVVPAEFGADTVASWLRDTPTFSPADFAGRFPELAVRAGAPTLLIQLARAGVLAQA